MIGRMGALKDDEPQFQELTGDELAKAAAEYKRIWGSDISEGTPDEPDTSKD